MTSATKKEERAKPTATHGTSVRIAVIGPSQTTNPATQNLSPATCATSAERNARIETANSSPAARASPGNCGNPCLAPSRRADSHAFLSRFRERANGNCERKFRIGECPVRYCEIRSRIHVSRIGTLRVDKRSANSESGIRKSEKRFVKTGSGVLDSEKGIGDSLKSASKSETVFGEGKTGRGKLNEQFTPEIVSPLINQQ